MALQWDPTTEEWVGEYPYWDPADPSVRRRLTEWFATKAEAIHFSQHGPEGGVNHG